eukprot:m.280403 g.280403  ORF g.280403 m.280403 type:complete len:77 (+) comp16168_c0_seq1:175-405(+)
MSSGPQTSEEKGEKSAPRRQARVQEFFDSVPKDSDSVSGDQTTTTTITDRQQAPPSDANRPRGGVSGSPRDRGELC